MKKVNKLFFGILLFLNLCLSQTSLSILEYHPFPKKMKILDLNPTIINWSIDNSFLLLDKYKKEIFRLDNFGQINLGSLLNINSNSYGDIVWIGVSPIGIQVLDRLENQILFFDHRLNPIANIKMEKKIFPEIVTIDSRGTLYLYSRSYNSIYTFENNKLNDQPFINLKNIFSNSFCVEKISINQNFELGILDCNSILHLFNRNGKKEKSFNAVINDAKFLISVRDDWLVFNRQGNGISIMHQASVVIPHSSTPLYDVSSLNKSLAILSNDHILIMDVK